jgi:tryptophan synthase alpha chain
MNRLSAVFEALRETEAKALMPFVTAGDPCLEALGPVLSAIEEGGGSVVEIGLPFTDPIADGPVIQASMQRALDAGVTVDAVFAKIRAVRPSLKIALVAMVSFSIVHRWGVERFLDEAIDAGFDGFIFPDLPFDAAGSVVEAARRRDSRLSLLVSPTTPLDRARDIAAASSGFVYVLSRAGITGTRSELPAELPARLAVLRGVTDAPLAVGFGISTAEQVAAVVAEADAAIVGSAMVARLRQTYVDSGENIDAVAEAALNFTRDLAAGLKASVHPAR